MENEEKKEHDDWSNDEVLSDAKGAYEVEVQIMHSITESIHSLFLNDGTVYANLASSARFCLSRIRLFRFDNRTTAVNLQSELVSGSSVATS